MWTVTVDTAELQKQDDSLKPLFTRVCGKMDVKGEGKERFVIENGVICLL